MEKKNCARTRSSNRRADLGRGRLGRKLCEYQNRFAVYCLIASFEVELGRDWWKSGDSKYFEVHFH